MRPGVFYRQEFRRQILAESPQRVLEVGCGDGGLLRTMLAAGVHAEGLEADAAKVATLRAAGLSVQHTRGEVLPFAAASFDCVVSEHAAHHLADLSLHLREAMRVARRAVLLLDPWYDLSLASQRTAERWDRWFKAIDRQNGMVHHDVLGAEAFRAAMPAGCDWSFECRHYLRLVAIDDAKFEAENATCLELAPDRAAAVTELAAIRQDRALHGMSDDGAIFVLLRAPNATTAPAG